MPAGRPTKYNQDMVDKAYAYIDGGYIECGDKIPSHAGMACELNIGKSTLYDWADDPEKEFSDILAKCNIAQERKLLNGGLSGDFNAAITKLALGKQGYSDRIEQDNLHSFDLSGHSLEQLDEIIDSQKS